VIGKVYATLSTIGYPVREQGSYAATEVLPATLVTYQVIGQAPSGHADGLPTGFISRIQVALYSTDPAITQTALRTFLTTMQPAGFLFSSGRQLPLDEQSGHYGFTADFKIYESEV
jgi:hypothetical protein